jgi:hypothetical protein
VVQPAGCTILTEGGEEAEVIDSELMLAEEVHSIAHSLGVMNFHGRLFDYSYHNKKGAAWAPFLTY